MSQIDAYKSLVEKYCKELIGSDELNFSETGAIMLQRGSFTCGIEVLDVNEQLLVRIWGYLALGIKSSGKLLEQLNELNAGTTRFKAYVNEDTVICEGYEDAETIDEAAFRRLVDYVSKVGDNCDTELVAKFGGQTFMPDTDDAAGGGAVDV